MQLICFIKLNAILFSSVGLLKAYFVGPQVGCHGEIFPSLPVDGAQNSGVVPFNAERQESDFASSVRSSVQPLLYSQLGVLLNLSTRDAPQ